MTNAFALTQQGVELSWPVDPRWCSWNGLWGGALLGIAIAALEKISEQPVCAISAQFLGPVTRDDMLTFRSQQRATGREVAQAHIDVVAGERVALSATAVLSRRPIEPVVTSVPAAVKSPEECPPRAWLKRSPGGLQDSMQTHIARQDGDNVALWVRWAYEDAAPLSAAMVAAAADNPAYALLLATNGVSYGITLDTSLRLLELGDELRGDDWLLVDTRFDVRATNVAFATAHIWGRGRLLAICTQTLRVRNV